MGEWMDGLIGLAREEGMGKGKIVHMVCVSLCNIITVLGASRCI